jgi:glycerol uptake facilitator-like aquaporin
MIPSLIAEFIGTFIFLSIILIQGEPIPIAVGLLASIYAFGKISGGHFNPAVSYIMFLKNTIDIPTFMAYIVVQILGASLAYIWWNYLNESKIIT